MIAAGVILAAPAGGGTLTTSRDWAYALAVQPDGKLVAAGLRSGPGREGLALARYTVRGRLDGSFGRGGKVVARVCSCSYYPTRATHDVAVQRNGKILASRSSTVVRYRADGSLDTAFGHGGRIPGGPFALQDNGKILTVGTIGRKPALIRYDAQGRLDRSFGHAGKARIAAGGYVVLQPDRKIVIAWTDFAHGTAVARYNADGTPDLHFGKGGEVLTRDGAELQAVALQPDGKIVTAGAAGDQPGSFALARFTSDGAPDPDFGDGGRVSTYFTRASNCGDCRNVAYAVAVQPDGKIVAAGESGTFRRCDRRGHSCGDFALVRYESDGTLDETFGSGGKVVTHFEAESPVPSSSIAESLVIQRDGKLVVAGLGAGYDFGLARYTRRGRLDPTFGHAGKVLTDFGSG
jgi:uncharacterized delta-60 repeat protein